jgi:glycosyltransferase involved in cell wall biosynthesis
VGSFRPYKRVDLVVTQAARWPEVEFRLCGRGEEEERCRRLAGNAANVHFLGHLGQAELGKEMRAADLFFFPSELEGQPQVLLQAAASGLPCIARGSYRPDSVVDGKTGFLSRNDVELEQKLECLIKDQSLRERMSKAAAEHSKQFDWDRSAAHWANAFEKAATKRR